MSSPLKYVLSGASGVGKSTTLLFIGHMARKSNCMVLPIQGRCMREVGSPNVIAYRVLRHWMKGNRELLQKLQGMDSSAKSILELVDRSERQCSESATILNEVITLFREMDLVPVIFLIDQCNALQCIPSSADSDPWDILCSSVADFNTFQIERAVVFLGVHPLLR